jgi:hypothetical protein
MAKGAKLSMKKSLELTVSKPLGSVRQNSGGPFEPTGLQLCARENHPILRPEIPGLRPAGLVSLGFGLATVLMCFFVPRSVVYAQTNDASPKNGQQSTNVDGNDLGPGYPRLDDPWNANKSPLILAKAEAAPEKPAQPTASTPPASETTTTTEPPAESAALAPPKIRRNEISASGDFFLGQGSVTMPFGFSLSEGFGGASTNVIKSVAKPDRTSDYFGGTISYSPHQGWYVDLAYANGTSSGNADVVLGSPPTLNSAFTIKDNWYQAYIRYTFPGLRGKKVSAYLRAGASYVQAELTDETTIPALGLYQQTDKTDDILGNLGFGASYLLFPGRIRVSLQMEGEGFFGRRSQKSTESLANALFTFPTANIDNDLYGGIGRGTVDLQYSVGQSGAFKIFADGGLQAKFTMISYSSGLGTFNELLWGPYIKVGVRFSF